MTRSASTLGHRSDPRALANEPYISEPFGEFPILVPAWSLLSDALPQSHQTSHADPRSIFLAVDDDDDMEDDDLFDDEEDEDDLLDDDDEDDDEDDFFDDDEDDFDDDEEDDDDDDSYFLGDDDD